MKLTGQWSSDLVQITLAPLSQGYEETICFIFQPYVYGKKPYEARQRAD